MSAAGVTVQEKNWRLNAVASLMADRYSTAEIVAMIRDGDERVGFQVGERAARNYIAEVRKMWAQDTPELSDQKEHLRQSLDKFIRKAEAKGEFNAVARMLGLLADLDGMTSKINVQVGGTQQHLHVGSAAPATMHVLLGDVSQMADDEVAVLERLAVKALPAHADSEAE